MKCTFSDQEQILQLLNGLNNQLSPKFERCAGISSSRFDILYELYGVEEMTQSHLQKAVHIDASAITRHLKQLEADGMVTRRRNPSDNRETFVQLTEEGLQRIDGYKKEKIGFVNQMLKDFNDEELTVLKDMLTRLQQNISQY
ncbi:MarR family winged helix-turn-helix transcriptional regulator [Paenibacillus sp. XY044]|uniref:MarR family winged helix-turn-helix transcriptional regulator n=1 Tax=Paenibacillus sp. XY044 TaxID=2026089 RepID=UPI000B98AA22|nr:MarR family transcriptional regulator [Paenibacillus sp. XY044]OZB95349.1 transcriptional regulator [Paenibacillus sp. XY044]